ncbi:MAG: hypothetical protein QM820_63210 [Minicystis sp.]
MAATDNDEAVDTQDDAITVSDIAPSGRGFITRDVHAQQGGLQGPGEAKPSGGGTSSNGISYHGGPVMTNASGNTLYYIWYGNWSGNSATTILPDFAQHLGGSPYWNINTTYTDGNGNHVANALAYGGATTVAYPYGTALSDAQIQQVVADAINGNKLPKDANGIYFVLTSADVTASSGFCSSYCGWHTHAAIGGSDIKYAFIGNADRCPSSCGAQTVGPNGNAGADSMASIIAHEAEEAASDPDLNAWYDRRGYENADKCAWTFGTTYTTSNGAKANMKLGTRDYLIQQNWVNASGGYCAVSY